MSNGTINKMIVIGYVGADPIFKKTDLFTVCNLTLATNEKTKNGQETEWHRCVFYNKLADIVNSYVKKGDKIFVEGKVKTRKWTDKNDKEHVISEIIVNEMTILSNKAEVKAPEQNNDTDEFGDEDIPF